MAFWNRGDATPEQAMKVFPSLFQNILNDIRFENFKLGNKEDLTKDEISKILQSAKKDSYNIQLSSEDRAIFIQEIDQIYNRLSSLLTSLPREVLNGSLGKALKQLITEFHSLIENLQKRRGPEGGYPTFLKMFNELRNSFAGVESLVKDTYGHVGNLSLRA